MARILIISIADNDAAEAWARQLLESETHGTPMPPNAELHGLRLEAMIARPTLACPNNHGRQGRIGPKLIQGFTRTVRFGWFVCPECRRPAKAVVENFIRNMLGGYNDLLPTLSGGQPVPPPWTKETTRAVQVQHSRP